MVAEGEERFCGSFIIVGCFEDRIRQTEMKGSNSVFRIQNNGSIFELKKSDGFVQVIRHYTFLISFIGSDFMLYMNEKHT